MKNVQVANFLVGEGQALSIVSGPCVIESEDHCMLSAQSLKEIFSHHWVNFIFKASYDKANRTSIRSFRGPGLEEGLRILEKVKREFDVPVVTDVHSPEEARAAAEVVDLLQIPAFLCRQTDLLVAAGESGLPVFVKKGQFLAPWDMEHVVNKLLSTGNQKIILCDRGTSFGYNNLVADFRSIPLMKRFGYPVAMDCTHSVQLPGGQGEASGGQSEFAPMIAKMAVVGEANMLFIEAHPEPKRAKSDADSQVAFKDLPKLLTEIDQIYTLLSNW